MADFEPEEDFETDETSTAEPVELESDEEANGNAKNWRDFYKGWPAWAVALSKVVAGLVIVMALVFLGRFIHHHLKNNSASTATKTGNSSQVSKAPATQPGAGSSTSNGTSNSGSGSTAKPPSSTASATQVPNTGPGDTLAIFVGSSLVGTALHYGLKARPKADRNSL